MIFFLGFICGLALGALVMHLVNVYFDSMIDGQDPGKCPPCNGQCEQGRKCPANKGESK